MLSFRNEWLVLPNAAELIKKEQQIKPNWHSVLVLSS